MTPGQLLTLLINAGATVTLAASGVYVEPIDIALEWADEIGEHGAAMSEVIVLRQRLEAGMGFIRPMEEQGEQETALYQGLHLHWVSIKAAYEATHEGEVVERAGRTA